jgi:hypothetical protein
LPTLFNHAPKIATNYLRALFSTKSLLRDDVRCLKAGWGRIAANRAITAKHTRVGISLGRVDFIKAGTGKQLGTKNAIYCL